MVIGYVFSRKENKDVPICINKPPDYESLNKKLYKLLKDYVFNLGVELWKVYIYVYVVLRGKF